MLSAFPVNYVTGRRQITNVKVDRRLCEVFLPGKKYVKKQDFFYKYAPRPTNT